MQNKYFVLYTSCVLVKGYTRSVVCDLQRSNFEFVPNALFDLLSGNTPFNLSDCLRKNLKNAEVIIEYFQFLEKNEFGFFTDDPENFPQLDLSYSTPYKISNAIIDYNENSSFSIKDVVEQLDEIKCQFIELRFYNSFSLENLIASLTPIKGSRVRSIGMYIKFDELVGELDYLDLIQKFPRIEYLIVHSAPFNKNYSDFEKYKHLTVLQFTTTKVLSESCCGRIDPKYFSINQKFYRESLIANTCLNGKISVDKDGEIKNCPSSQKSYGNVDEVKISKILSVLLSNKLTKIIKDEINTCQDCEFRRICPDCRIYTENSEIYGKPKKCNYNPYIGKWNE